MNPNEINSVNILGVSEEQGFHVNEYDANLQKLMKFADGVEMRKVDLILRN